MKQCPKCGGTGEIHDDIVLGMRLRKSRETAGVTLREAAKRMGITPAYLCDLEHGRRSWSVTLQEKFAKAAQ